MAKHKNNGKCEACQDIMNKYGVDDLLRSWFTMMQAKYSQIHTSCAGRSQREQDVLYAAGRTRAVFGMSPHNFTPALGLDIFRLISDNAEFERQWYVDTLIPEMPKAIMWGGDFKKFPDCPHFELKDWRSKAKIKIWSKE